ncbi:hypothetical protein RhiirC2_850671 [Rhizophagus irregularis]|uniref:F-box domain-containing protein n=2 Tax=Rhizophagus irregularis TaxID=588596 RepID=A0A2N1N6I0_9GLOM|nr:hypothetical protein RhiirC2_850671 [Rhizophagus irregularis]
MQRFTINTRFSRRPSIFNNDNTPKRCETDIVRYLPVEILIQIFNNVFPVDLMRIGDDFEDFIIFCEIERIILRLTCRKWNNIIINLIKHASFDIFKIKKCKLGYVVPPPNLKKLEITDSRYLHANSCDPYSLYNPYNWSSRLGRSDINEWLINNKRLNCLKVLHLRGCVDFTVCGLTNLYEQLIELSIVDCPKITVESLKYMLKHMKNLETLTINTDKFFSSEVYKTINLFLPKLNNLRLIIPCQCCISSSRRDIIIQITDLSCLPTIISNLTISQKIPSYDNHIFHILSSTPPPNSLRRLDVSNCFFLKDLFDITPTLTHLTVSYPSFPRNAIKLPSTLEYLNISGYVRDSPYTSESTNFCDYSKKWIDMFPEDAPSLHTLILHLYASPERLFSAILKFSNTIRHLDCRILLSHMSDICMCENPCHLGRQLHFNMIRELKNLKELKFHSRLEKDEIENFPVSLKKLWIINVFNNRSLIDFANRRGIEVLELHQI